MDFRDWSLSLSFLNFLSFLAWDEKQLFGETKKCFLSRDGNFSSSFYMLRICNTFAGGRQGNQMRWKVRTWEICFALVFFFFSPFLCRFFHLEHRISSVRCLSGSLSAAGQILDLTWLHFFTRGFITSPSNTTLIPQHSWWYFWKMGIIKFIFDSYVIKNWLFLGTQVCYSLVLYKGILRTCLSNGLTKQMS